MTASVRISALQRSLKIPGLICLPVICSAEDPREGATSLCANRSAKLGDFPLELRPSCMDHFERCEAYRVPKSFTVKPIRMLAGN